MSARMFVVAVLASFFLAACGATEAEPVPEATPEETPCCSIDDVIEMSKAGVDEGLIITSIQKSEVKVDIGAKELIRLNDAGVSKPVQQALMGEDPEAIAAAAAEEKAAAEAAEAEKKAAAEAAKPKGPPPLRLSVQYNVGSKSFKLTNTSGKTYTGLVITANGQYVYALPVPLPPGNPDAIKLASMNSSKTEHRLHPNEGIQRLYIKADQGTWSKRF